MARGRRNTTPDLVRLLNELATPAYLLDEGRRLVWANPSLARLVNLPLEQLLGKVCGYHSQPLDDPLAAALAALGSPPETQPSRLQQGCIVLPPALGGTTRALSTRLVPLSDPVEPPGPVLVLVQREADPLPSAFGQEQTPHQLHSQLAQLRSEMAGRYRLERLLGQGPAMLRARAQAELAIGSRASVLIVGPRASGKRHLARVIHYGHWARSAASPGPTSHPGRLATPPPPLVDLAAGQVDDELLRTTIEALPGGNESTPPAGTLLVSDVDQLAPAAQAALAQYARRPSRLRLIASAQTPLDRLAREGRYSDELAARLGTLVIELPALAERLSDLPLLAQVYLEEANAGGGKQVGGFTPAAMDRLLAHDWPGNLDELGSMIRAAHREARGPLISETDLPTALRPELRASKPSTRLEPIDLGAVLADLERGLIERAIKQARGNKTRAARLVGLTRPRFYRRLVQLGLEPAPLPPDDDGEVRFEAIGPGELDEPSDSPG